MVYPGVKAARVGGERWLVEKRVEGVIALCSDCRVMSCRCVGERGWGLQGAGGMQPARVGGAVGASAAGGRGGAGRRRGATGYKVGERGGGR